MKKIILTLVIILSVCPIIYAQRYQGSAAFGASVIGVSVNNSHGVRFEKDYIGLGSELGIWSLIFVNRAWCSLYADYQRYFPISSQWSLFLQASPGMCMTEFSVIGDSSNNSDSDSERTPERGLRAYTKLGAGVDWQWSRCGLSLSIQNNLFTTNHASANYHVTWLPFLQLSFHW